MTAQNHVRNRNVIGIASLCFGVMIFSTQDAIIKHLSGDYPVTLAIVVRSLVALPILLTLVHFECGLRSLLSRNYKPLLFRGLILLVSYTTYYMALPALPLAEAIALFFTAPIMVNILAGPLLGETVSPRTWAAVACGFIGVLVILRPGSSIFEAAAFLSLISALTYALSMVLARKLGGTEPSSVMTFYVNGVYLAGAALIALGFQLVGIVKLGHPSLDFLVRPWSFPGTWDLFLMGLCGIIAAVAMSLLTHAYRMAEANLVAVYEYTGMIWGPLWGFLFFQEVPRITTAIGMALIIAAGIAAARVSQKKGEA